MSGLNQKVPEILSTVERLIHILITDESPETLPKMQRLLAVALVTCLSESRVSTVLFNNTIATVEDNTTAYNSAITLARVDQGVDYVD